nr:hypothetical protein [uncultured Kingella sp.]
MKNYAKGAMQMGDVNGGYWRGSNTARWATGAIFGSLKTLKPIGANPRGSWAGRFSGCLKGRQ